MRQIYYFEINAFCILILVILFLHVNENSERINKNFYLSHMIFWTFVTCISDLIAGVWKGAVFEGSWLSLWLTNALYIISMTVLGYYWVLFAHLRLYGQDFSRKVKVYFAIPMWLIVVLTLTSQWTGWIFRMDELSQYQRGSHLWLHWVITWGYMLFPSIVGIVRMIKTRSKYERQSMFPIALFILFPAIGSAVQILFYGTTVIQVGVILSLLIVAFNMQNEMIFLDALTKLNNRGFLDRWLDDHFTRKLFEEYVFVFMIDVNDFKTINDTFGHQVGDQALIRTAEVFKNFNNHVSDKLFIARYGGDEFVIIGTVKDPGRVKELEKILEKEMKAMNEKCSDSYQISLSIGSVIYRADELISPDHLLNEADQAMYLRKEEYKKTHVTSRA